jgi:hypothetical protein
MLQEKFEEGTRTVPQDPTMLDIFPIFNKRNFTRVELADLMKVAQSMIKIGMDQRESWNFYHIAEASTKRSRATGAATPQGEIGEVADFAQSTFDLPLELIYGLLSEAVINRHTQVVATNATKQAQTWQKEKKIYFAPTAISPNPCGSFLRRPQMI